MLCFLVATVLRFALFALLPTNCAIFCKTPENLIYKMPNRVLISLFYKDIGNNIWQALSSIHDVLNTPKEFIVTFF